MKYKIDDSFLDMIDELLDSIMEASQYTDILEASRVAMTSLDKVEKVKKLAVELCNKMDDGFPDYGEEDDNGNEEETEECTDSGDDDPDYVHLDPDCDGSGFVAY